VIFSSDAGNTWTSVGGAITANTDVSSVLVNGQVMFVASRSFGQSGDSSVPGLFRSTDGGASFIQLSGSGGLPTGSVTSLVSETPATPTASLLPYKHSGFFAATIRAKPGPILPRRGATSAQARKISS
jgi:hypothetical protein